MNITLGPREITCYLIILIFFAFGILNLIYIHAVPGIFYLVLALLYFPQTDQITSSLVGFTIPFWIKLIIALFVLWGSLAVGELWELAEDYI